MPTATRRIHVRRQASPAAAARPWRRRCPGKDQHQRRQHRHCRIQLVARAERPSQSLHRGDQVRGLSREHRRPAAPTSAPAAIGRALELAHARHPSLRPAAARAARRCRAVDGARLVSGSVLAASMTRRRRRAPARSRSTPGSPPPDRRGRCGRQRFARRRHALRRGSLPLRTGAKLDRALGTLVAHLPHGLDQRHYGLTEAGSGGMSARSVARLTATTAHASDLPAWRRLDAPTTLTRRRSAAFDGARPDESPPGGACPGTQRTHCRAAAAAGRSAGPGGHRGPRMRTLTRRSPRFANDGNVRRAGPASVVGGRRLRRVAPPTLLGRASAGQCAPARRQPGRHSTDWWDAASISARRFSARRRRAALAATLDRRRRVPAAGAYAAAATGWHFTA